MDNPNNNPNSYQPDSNPRKSGIHAILNTEDMLYNQSYDVSSKPLNSVPNQYEVDPNLQSIPNKNMPIEPNEVARRVAHLSINSPRNRHPPAISPYQSGSSRCDSPNSNQSGMIRSHGSLTPYYTRSTGTNSRDEINSSSGKPNETAIEKRQRRLIRNRIAAQDSRLKKKMYVSELEEKVKRLENENFKLHHDIVMLNDKLQNGVVINEIDQETITANHHQPLLPPDVRKFSIPEHLLPPRPLSTPPVSTKEGKYKGNREDDEQN
ncbi:hypothetical protein K502DRAFT_63462 [Neoconidiobolus thromboides FSU 785]|nr:hypothetical protein K502DRAFT_63462 [Neoconidiobolus thromboides FSU 785]